MFLSAETVVQLFDEEGLSTSRYADVIVRGDEAGRYEDGVRDLVLEGGGVNYVDGCRILLGPVWHGKVAAARCGRLMR